MQKKHIAVLMGGLSPERDVSLASGQACASALRQIGHYVTEVDVGHDIDIILRQLKPDVAFNALHGSWGEDGFIQGLLEYLQIPYTHSGVLASSLAMDKARAKTIVQAAGVKIASSKICTRFELVQGHPIDPPYVVKPLASGSSFGVVIVNENDPLPQWDQMKQTDGSYGDHFLIEPYIAGRDLTCAVMGDKSLGVCEIIITGQSFYDFEAKYAKNGSKHVCPAEILPNIYQEVERMSVMAHCALGCRGVSRSDFRYDDSGHGQLIWLELNTQPGMTTTSLVPDIAQAYGYSFIDVVSWMVEDASCMR